MTDELTSLEDLVAASDGEAVLLLEDGGFGTMLAAAGVLAPGQAPYRAVLEHPDAVRAIHRAYVEAGAQVIVTNTFGATRWTLGDADAVEALNTAAVTWAREAHPEWVLGDLGPIGELLEPYGELEESEAFELFAEQAGALEAAGCDGFAIETMTDLTEALTAVRAVRSASRRPIFVTMSFGEGGRTFMGVSPEDAVEALAAFDIQAIGANCSVGPAAMAPVIRAFVAAMHEWPRPLPIIAKPNAGLPRRSATGETIYDLSPLDFSTQMEFLLEAGASIIGGCCGTTPDHIAALAEAVGRR